MKLKFINTLLVGLLLSLSSVANAGLIQFKSESAGYDADYEEGNYAYLSVNGSDVINRGSRGVNIAVFDLTGLLQGTASFDTWADDTASSALANYIIDITAGFTVLLAVNDDATLRFYDDARLAIQTLGGSTENIAGLEFRSSYALIGIAGSGVGTRSAFEASSSDSSVAVSDSLNVDPGVTDPVEVSEPTTIALFALSILGLAARRFKK